MTQPTPPLRGFVLQPTYRLISGQPVVHLYGRLEDGSSFLVRDSRQVPHFFVETRDAERARELGAGPLRPTDKRTLTGQAVLRVEVQAPADTPPLRARLMQAGVRCHEADVRFAMRYLINRGVRGSLEIRGESQRVPGVGLVFDEPAIGPADWVPALSVLSLDVETDPQGKRLLSIALHGCGVSEVLLLTPPGSTAPAGASACGSESELLLAFGRRVRELDPDVLTGWNVVEFDLRVLLHRADQLRLPLELGRGAGGLRLRVEGGVWGSLRASVPGRVVLDGIHLLRGAFVRMEEYTLDHVARSVLGEGKGIAGRGRAAEILRLFEEDRPRFVEYNRTDARLALEIVQRMQLVELAVERSRLTGMPLDRVASSIAAFDFLYLSELGRRGVVGPSVGAGDVPAEATGGGHVLEPLPGLYRNVVVLDFKSLYPSIIRTFQIDPMNLVRQPVEPLNEQQPTSGAEFTSAERAGVWGVRRSTPQLNEGAEFTSAALIEAPNGALFARRRGILPGILDEIMPRREAAQRAGDRVKSHAIKILMNSFYGVLGTPACRFYDPRLANAITSFGREILLWTKSRIESGGRRVLYGDTDSLFVESGEDDAAAALRLGESLAEDVDRALAAHVARTWRVESRLSLRFERLYLRLLLPSVRFGTAGARKRYAGLIQAPDGERVVFTGMEAVRGDWTELAKQVQHELYARLFTDRPLEEYLRQVVSDLRAGLLDELVVYRKALRKAPGAYTATTPPHVAAARKLGRLTRGRISYVMTTAGPEPAHARGSPIDHEHYVQKQVRPVAEPVLLLLGLDFAKVVGDDRQLLLF